MEICNITAYLYYNTGVSQNVAEISCLVEVYAL